MFLVWLSLLAALLGVEYSSRGFVFTSFGSADGISGMAFSRSRIRDSGRSVSMASGVCRYPENGKAVLNGIDR